MTVQPSEFAKAATALAVAKYISDLNTDVKRIKDQINVLALVAIPAILVLLQKDAGSTLVYGCFIFISNYAALVLVVCGRLISPSIFDAS